MRKLVLTNLVLFFAAQLSAQTLAERIGTECCRCIGDITSLDSISMKFKACFGTAYVAVGDSVEKPAFTVEAITKLADDVFVTLPSVCPAVQRLVLIERKSKFYGPSPSSSANGHYDRGNEKMNSGDFAGAANDFRKAIKSDDEFVPAIDNMASCYRRLDKFEEAEKYYKRSLGIFPEGDFALVNLGVVYFHLGKWEDATQNYEKMVFLYPDNPEGYYGLARVAMGRKDYERALQYVCQAHVRYVMAKSHYESQTTELINTLYSTLKEAGKEQFFIDTLNRSGIEVKR